ncbi:hypothetical protein TPA0909_53430 [Streptomyces albus]|nr:hypothetical protein TPA0909_53430 [Streptomyces albus]
MAICFVIASYYAVIVAWAIRYAGFSFGKDWGKEPEKFFSGDFLHAAAEPGLRPVSSATSSGRCWPSGCSS